jgi:hypothetical protein
MDNVGIFYSLLVCFAVIWYILWPFGLFCGPLINFMVKWYIFSVLVRWTKENLATLPQCENWREQDHGDGIRRNVATTSVI